MTEQDVVTEHDVVDRVLEVINGMSKPDVVEVLAALGERLDAMRLPPDEWTRKTARELMELKLAQADGYEPATVPNSKRFPAILSGTWKVAAMPRNSTLYPSVS